MGEHLTFTWDRLFAYRFVLRQGCKRKPLNLTIEDRHRCQTTIMQCCEGSPSSMDCPNYSVARIARTIDNLLVGRGGMISSSDGVPRGCHEIEHAKAFRRSGPQLKVVLPRRHMM